MTNTGAILSFLALLIIEIEAQVDPKWTLLYSEDFSTPLKDDETTWYLEDYSKPFDTIVEDNGLWYENDYGPAWNEQFESFATYRKEFPVGQDGWLTASLSARDWNKDGIIESPPILERKQLGGRFVAEMKTEHTTGVLFRNTRPLPSEYRIEYKLMTLDYGGKRNGTLEYDGRFNGFSTEGCKTRHPWGSGSRSRGWSGNASVPYCEWEDLREGETGYNGLQFLTITDFADPAPRNNRFWHYHRKLEIAAFSQSPARVGDGTGGRICNSATNEYYDFRDSSFNIISMWIGSLPNWTPKNAPSNRQWYMSTCSGGVAQRDRQIAAEMQPELMPNEFYTFAVERNKTGYTLETSGNFAHSGNQTLRFYRPFVVDDVPIWHYNVDSSEYDGRFNGDLIQEDFSFGSMVWPDEWPAGSAYPDYFAIGDVYTNAYEGSASLTDIRLYGLKSDTDVPTPASAGEPPTTSPTDAPTTMIAPVTGAPSTAPPSTAPPVISGQDTDSPTVTSGGQRPHFILSSAVMLGWWILGRYY